MRVPTFHSSTHQFQAIEDRLARQARLSEQVATGLRVTRPGDDPLAAAQAELSRSELATLGREQRAARLAQGLMASADEALSRGTGALQSARELLVAAGNGSYSAQDRHSLATQLRAIREELRALIATPDGAGGFVFGADAGQGEAGLGLALRVGEDGCHAASVDGRAAFLALPEGNGVFTTASAAGNAGSGWIGAGSVADPAALTGHRYTLTVGGAPGALTLAVQDVDTGVTVQPAQPLTLPAELTVDGQRLRLEGTPAPGDTFDIAPAGRQGLLPLVDGAIAWLEDAALPAHLRHEHLGLSLAGLDRALEAFSLLRSQVGSEQGRAEATLLEGESRTLAVTARRSQLQDADLAEAVSSLQSNQAGLEAALKAYASIGQLSLMRLLP